MNSRAKELRESLKIMGLHYSDNITFQKGIEHALSTPSVLRHADPEIMKQAGWESSEWISLEDRLPDWYKPVLIYDSQTEDTHKAWIASDGNNYFFTVQHSDIILPNPTHWKLLPQPPKI